MVVGKRLKRVAKPYGRAVPVTPPAVRSRADNVAASTTRTGSASFISPSSRAGAANSGKRIRCVTEYGDQTRPVPALGTWISAAEPHTHAGKTVPPEASRA